METFLDLFSTQGRANRSWYFWHILLDDVVMVTMLVLLVVLGLTVLGPIVLAPAAGVLAGGFWAGVCITVKRLHDLDRPGWHWWLLGVPLYNIYLGLVLLFGKGTDGPNNYGRDPLRAATVSTSHQLES